MGLTDEHQVLLIVMDLIKNKSIWYKKHQKTFIPFNLLEIFMGFNIIFPDRDPTWLLLLLGRFANAAMANHHVIFPGSEKVNHTLGPRKVVRNPNDLPSLPVIPPEVWCLIGMFWGFKYLLTFGVWKPRVDGSSRIQPSHEWFGVALPGSCGWEVFFFCHPYEPGSINSLYWGWSYHL